MKKYLFDCYLNGRRIILLTTQDGREYLYTNNGKLIPLNTKNHPVGGNRLDDDQEKH